MRAARGGSLRGGSTRGRLTDSGGAGRAGSMRATGGVRAALGSRA